jgi:cytochrome c oxidase assembly factor CtaG
MADPLVLLRWLDVILVVLAAPFAIVMGAAPVGYAVGAAAWIVNRAIGAAVERRAQAETDIRRTVGMNLGALIARSWLVGLSILAVGLAGDREDGLTAAILVLAAFTLYFVTQLFSRSLEGKTTRP